MEFTGRIIQALEPRSGVSGRTGNPWKMQDFVIEEAMGQYPKRMVFNVFGEDNLNRFNIQVGQELTVSFDINAREYNGRWYNDVRVWNVVPATPAVPIQPGQAAQPFAPFPPADQAPAQPAQPAQQQVSFDAIPDESSDLPF